MAALGFSYGETLTLQLLNGNPRFHAAIVGGGTPDVLPYIFTAIDAYSFWPLFADMWGISHPYETETLERTFKETPLFYLSRIQTPVLIESGEYDSWKNNQWVYDGLRSFGVPAEHYMYPRSGHGWDEAALLEDSYNRQIAWIDYWLRDAPYGDAERQRRYDAWKERRLRLPQH
jgi:dipeptidyl aminopeptidase/acylaminoacyl peptidase